MWNGEHPSRAESRPGRTQAGDARSRVTFPGGVGFETSIASGGWGAELIGGIPKALFQRGIVGVLLRCCDPDHEFPVRWVRVTAWARKLSPSPGWRQVSVVIAMPRAM